MSTTEDRTAPTPAGLGLVVDLIRRCPPTGRRLTTALVLSALSGVSAVAGLVGLAFAAGAVLGEPDGPAAMTWTAVAAVALLLSFAARCGADHVAHHATFDLETQVRRRLADAVARMPLGEVQRLGAGRITKVMQSDVRSLHLVTADAVPFVGASVAQPVAALAVLGVVQWRLLLVVLLVVPLMLLCLSLLTRDYAVQRARYDRSSEQVNAAVVEFVQGMPVVRTFDDGRASVGRFATAVHDFTAAVREWVATSRTAGIVTQVFVGPLPTLLVVAAAGVPMLGAGWISPTELLVGLLVGAMPVEAVAPLMHLTNFINEAKAGAARIGELLAVPPLPEPVEPRTPVGGEVELSGVTFHYSGAREPALDDVSITVPAGTVCALVGPSGAGKSTIARLVPRFHDVQRGSVRVGGVDVRDIPTDVLLRHVALVFQDPFLVDDTIMANIRLGAPGATEDDAVAAAKAAAVHDFIVGDLPDGYDTRVGERGALLSGGQRQRVTIARAVLSDAPVVVLDEATAFADPETEADIQDALARLTRGRTVIVIAHRLFTVVDADRIVVVDRGRVVEQGSHADLLAADGRYARLWRHQQRAAEWGLKRGSSVEAGR